MRRFIIPMLLVLPLVGQPIIRKKTPPAARVQEKPFIAALRARAFRGQPEAQFELGVCYRFGQGVPRDEPEAVKWYLKAAQRGYDKAQYNLGVCYDSGTGISQDHGEAARWYRRAAQQGHAKAAYNLGVDYKYGQGVDRDEAEAYAWFDLAVSRGQEIAAASRDELAQGFDPGTLQRARERALALQATVKPPPAARVPGKKIRKAP